MSPRRPRKASQLATALIEHSLDAIVLVDETGDVMYANPATSTMLGRPIADVIGSNVYRWVHPEDLPAFRANFERRLSHPRVPIPNKFRLMHKDGTWRNVESVGVNRLDDPSIAGIILNYRDVTERQRTEQALQTSELRYRRLVEQANDIIYNCSADGQFTFVNPTAQRMMQYTQEELLGRHFLSLIRSDYQARVAAFYDRQRKEMIPSTYFEFPAIAKDGTEIWIGQNVQIQYEDGKPSGVQAIARDITARLALEDQLRQAQKMEAIGRLAGGLAHDFNNVLTAILGGADLLSIQLDPSDPRWEEAEAIKRAADRGAALTKRLLDFSRPHPASGTSVDVVASARHMEPMLQRLVLEKVAIEMVGEGPISVRAEESQIGQILMNLIVNARDAMPGGGRVKVEMTTTDLPQSVVSALGIQPGRYARIAVTDNGTGIPPEIQTKLFEPFFTTKDSAHGSGLGLSIVYGIVKGLGGAIELWSEVGHGTRFTIYLPLS